MGREVRLRWRGKEVKPVKLSAVIARSGKEYELWFDDEDGKRSIVSCIACGSAEHPMFKGGGEIFMSGAAYSRDVLAVVDSLRKCRGDTDVE